MAHEVKPITITPEQIIAAAQRLANVSDDAWQYSEAQWLKATEHWLRCRVNNLLRWSEEHSGEYPAFEMELRCDAPGCKTVPLPDDIFCAYHRSEEDGCGRMWEADAAEQFAVPAAPEWAQEPAQA